MKNAVHSSASAFQRRGSACWEWSSVAPESRVAQQYQLVLEKKYGYLH